MKTAAGRGGQANAIVAYREKNGSFKDLDGVKNVEGLNPILLT
jgi:DNA uptake protein ComE-like DNA-binding protein